MKTENALVKMNFIVFMWFNIIEAIMHNMQCTGNQLNAYNSCILAKKKYNKLISDKNYSK